MNGVHDLGGMHGFGPVEREQNEPVFHAEWEGIACSLVNLAMGEQLFNIDEFRYGIERMEPVHYLTSSYYEHWLASLERLLTEKGLITTEELAQREAEAKGGRLNLSTQPGSRDGATAGRRRSTQRDALEPRFQPGDAVLTSNASPHGHTRLPRYARGRQGTVERVHGTFVLPDTNAMGRGENPEPVYSVRFEAAELWGANAEPGQRVYLDLWESYLRPA